MLRWDLSSGSEKQAGAASRSEPALSRRKSRTNPKAGAGLGPLQTALRRLDSGRASGKPVYEQGFLKLFFIKKYFIVQ